MLLTRTLRVVGQVQGVGFRPFVYRIANELHVDGSVWNDQRGVMIEGTGLPAQLDELCRRIVSDAPALARVESIRCVGERPVDSDDLNGGFTITASDLESTTRGRVTVDSAVCPDCVRELHDEDDRRFGHALINCTNCGPRYTIVRDLPYDRARTTMAPFSMCPMCAVEYADPADRRFHAQPTCCPRCGPQIRLLDSNGDKCAGDPIARAAAWLREGRLLAMKGLGGYHLVADARDEEAVSRLRRGKRRDTKPFAIMVRCIDRARGFVRLSAEAETLLHSPICPIVLAPRCDGPTGVAPSVAPGCHRLGIMLPHTPMQHLLFAEDAVGDAPLIMTSANFSDDPLIIDDAEARQRLRDICDGFLTHDRPIERAVDDSIVVDTSLGLLPLRRARGYAPEPLPLPVASSGPGLCTGGELKNTIAVVRQGEAILSQHIGDLSWLLAYRRFEQAIDDLQRLFDVTPEWVASDLHPRYASHIFGQRLAADHNLDLVLVQHHHAHLASLLAEHHRDDRIIGLICDGVGYGDDGTTWGGEIMLGDLSGYERVGRLRPLRLPGGDIAAKRTGRCAVSWLFDTLGESAIDHPLAARALPDDRERELVFGLLRSNVHAPPSSGMGRLFDAVAALLGVCEYNRYEAMSGTLLEALAAQCRKPLVGENLIELTQDANGGGIMELDPRPLLKRLLPMAGRPGSAPEAAWLFHEALADGLARAARSVAEHTGLRTVGLSGGVFCNALLTRLVKDRLDSHGFEVLVHRAVPPNDGGVALGQAAVAAATLKRQATE